MRHQIHGQGLDTFTGESDLALVTVVKEFYLNAEDKAPFVAFVSRKQVPFGPKAINEFYNMRAPTLCKYSQLCDGNPDYDQILTEISKSGTSLIKGKKGGTLFMSKYLSLYGKIWYAFLCAKLSPSTHTSEVTKEKVLLLYSNVKDFDIDIGALISFSIRHCLRGPFSRGLPHPSLICGLYCQSGVRWAGNEPVQ